MTIDWWALALQAVNVLILIWLLSRVFWRPVAGAIATRREAAQTMLDTAKATQAQADAALAELTEARAGIAAEREAALAEAARSAEAASAAAAAQARAKADALLESARTETSRAAETARRTSAAQAASLAVDIAAKLLGRLDVAAAQAAFLKLLVDATADLPPQDRAALRAAPSGIDLVSAAEPDDTEQAHIREALGQALGGPVRLRFVTEPALIAGYELRTPHFALRNSWQSDLAEIRKELSDAA